MIDEIDLVRLIAEQAVWLRLCARLEAIADALPLLPEADELRLLNAQVTGLLQPQREVAEDTLERLFARDRRRPLACSLLDGIHAARAARMIDADDLITALRAARADGPEYSATTLGYMLRSFFQNCRNAVAIERLGLLALASERLTVGARALLTERLTEAQISN